VSKENTLRIAVKFNESAFKHGVTEEDIRGALSAVLFDEADRKDPDKYLALGFDTNGNLLEVIYNKLTKTQSMCFTR
jgi:hypothetical protein